MGLTIDANVRLFCEKMDITSSRMINEYALTPIDEIIEEEAKKGNTKAIAPGLSLFTSPERIIDVFNLNDIDNKFDILKKMDDSLRLQILPMLEPEDLAMGLYFFTQEKLLLMLAKVDMPELVNVMLSAFPLEKIIMMFKEEDLAKFFMNENVKKELVIENLKKMPHEMMVKFVESLTGMPAEQSNPAELIRNLEQLPTKQFQKVMTAVDPMVQRQLTFQITEESPEYLQLFENFSYLAMLNTLMKPDMVKPMIALKPKTLVEMISELPDEMMSIVAAQVNTEMFATFILDGHTNVLDIANMI